MAMNSCTWGWWWKPPPSPARLTVPARIAGAWEAQKQLVLHAEVTWIRAPMRYSGVIVKTFDGSRKTVIGEVDLPVKIGPSNFQITFQVMDIHPAYSCILGRPWIHEVGVVTSTLHQKLKFVKNGMLVIIGEEKALLVSHLSSFSYVEAEDEVGTPFRLVVHHIAKHMLT
ncbi:hypothetical protein KIW84_070108 [Lathyrus oleraceus]|uniref:Uncharacterized protein n=1 Tax=Pisum sativum TaxID=3888 RepID=A0A9D4VFU5_PEA|nr:hypothetical protein KIW84_070108 [Pisum sativum]